MSTHNLCFRAKIRKKVYPCTPQFHYIKVGCKGVLITRTCLHDGASGPVNVHLIPGINVNTFMLIARAGADHPLDTKFELNRNRTNGWTSNV